MSASFGTSPAHPDPFPVASLALERVIIRDLRNLSEVELEPSARLNVLSGANGQGKTSVLEAIYLLATSRSFRTAKLAEIVRHGTRFGVVRGAFCERHPRGVDRHEQSCAVERGRRTLRLDGKPPSSSTEYATRCPVVVFEPQQMTLTSGPAASRRTLLDRACLFLAPSYGRERARYRHALEARQALLSERRHPSATHDGELDAFETVLATEGARVTLARERAAAELAARAERAYGEFGPTGQILRLRYRPGGSADPDEARRALFAGRAADASRRRTGVGPHRDELDIELDGHLLRKVGSQGQHRAVTLALKIAELEAVAQARRAQPLLLLDDVSSELDEQRAAALFRRLGAVDCQLFLTTTRPGLIVAPELDGLDRADFELHDGALRRL